MSSEPTKIQRLRPDLWIPAAYLLLASTWIVTSDHALALLVSDPADLERWLTAKGTFFVVLTAALLHLVLRRWAGRNAEIEARLAASERRHREMVERFPEAVLVQQGVQIVFVNQAAVSLFGASSAAELIDRSVLDLSATPDHEAIRYRSARVEGGQAFPRLAERTLIRTDGRPFRAEVTLAPIAWEDRPAIEVVVRDVSQTWALQAEAKRLNATLRLLLDCNEALVRATSEAALLERICAIAVDQGGLRLAWVGYAEHDDAKRIRPVAHAGHEDGYLAQMNVSWADTERGRGPAGTAVREQRTVVLDHIDTDPRFGPWREAAMQRGYASNVCLPLVTSSGCIGMIGFFSGEPAAFDIEVLALLQRLADSLAFGIETLRARAEVERAQTLLQRAVEDLRALAGRAETIREEEKARIARDLHDELGQLLTALALDLSWLEERSANLPPDGPVNAMLDHVVSAMALVDQLVASARRIAADLRPSVLDRIGLGAALREELRRLRDRSGLICDLSLTGPIQDERGERATALFRIVQEGLTNVVRHAEARHVWVTLKSQSGALELRVEDDGHGYSEAQPGQRRGLGLLGIGERARRLGAEARFERSTHGGAAVIVKGSALAGEEAA